MEAAARDDIGVDRFLWGSDYPHDESTYPNTREAFRAFAGAPESELRLVLGGMPSACTTSTFSPAELSPIASVRPLRALRSLPWRGPGGKSVPRVGSVNSTTFPQPS